MPSKKRCVICGRIGTIADDNWCRECADIFFDGKTVRGLDGAAEWAARRARRFAKKGKPCQSR